jgi:hypothetical protein
MRKLLLLLLLIPNLVLALPLCPGSPIEDYLVNYDQSNNWDECKGSYKFLKGSKYYGTTFVGEWRNGKQDGQGTYIDSTGFSYEGEWKNGIMNGLGKGININGDTYEGQYKDGARHGQGTYTKSNGDEYSGIWKDGYNENFANDLPTKKASQNITPTATPASTPKVSIEDAKSQCTDIGFKTGTERFGECVLELMQ